MVDYSTALPQLQSYQAPNMLALAQQMQQLQTGNLGLQEKQRDLAESNALRSAIAGNVDPTTPEGQRAIISAAPKAGPALVKTYLEMAGQQRQNQTAQADLDIKNLGFHRNLLTTVVDQPTYAVWRANTIKDIPKLASGIPETYNEDTKRNLMTTADKMVDEYNQRTRPAVHTFGETPYSVTGTVATPITVGAPAAAAGAPAAAAAGAPAAAAAVGAPAAAAGAPAANNGYLAGLDRAEGRGRNPASSAQGKFQFINSTFVDTAKKVFPELADKSPAEILALRGTKLQDGSQIEDALEQRFRADNIASLASAGIQPTPGNVYLAHFLGPGGARNVLGADPNTPISQLVDSRAIDANKSVLEGKTAGEVQAWAANKFGGQSGMAASMAAGNARLGGGPAGFVPAGGAPMSLGAPTVNNALMMGVFGNQAAPTNNLATPAPIQMSLNPAIGGSAPAPGTPISAVKPQPGFRFNARGGQEPIPGSPESPEGIAAKVTATKTAEAAAAQETAKSNKKEGAQLLLRTVGGESSKKIEDLINSSTSGGLQHWAADKAANLGVATTGMQNIAQLDHIAKQMTFELLNGKLGSGISNADRDFISGMVADIANPDKPAKERIAGFRQLKNTIEAWASGKDVEIGAPAGRKSIATTPNKPAPSIHDQADAILRGEK